MQKCGQLQASMAVALMAQSELGGDEWPALTVSRARTASNAILCMEHPWGREYRPWRGGAQDVGGFLAACGCGGPGMNVGRCCSGGEIECAGVRGWRGGGEKQVPRRVRSSE